MGNSNLTLVQRYENFVASNSMYKFMSTSQVASIMLKQKLITEKECKELTQSLFVNNATKKVDWSNFKGYESMGLDLSANKNKNPKPTNFVEKTKTYHPKLTFLEVDSKGNPDLEQFSLTRLKLKFRNNKNYKIEQLENGDVQVTQKDGSLVLSYTENPYFNGQKEIKFVDGKNEQYVTLKDGKITEYRVHDFKNGVESYKVFNGSNNFLHSVSETYSNGDVKHTNYDVVTGKRVYQDFWRKNGNSAEWFVKYSNGKPYKKAKGYMDKNPEYILVNDLKDDIYAKTKLGLPTTRKSISENVLKRINNENVQETVEQYKKLTGKDLVYDIDSEIGLSKSLRNQLINHIETLYCKAAQKNESGKYLAKKLFDDIKGLGSGRLADHVRMINSENLKYVLVEYRNLTKLKNRDTLVQVYDLLNNTLGLNIPVDDIADKLAPLEGLLNAINGEVGLKKSLRESLIKQIVNTALEDKAPEVKARIQRDISSHPSEYNKLEVDLYRAENATGGDIRNPELNNANIETSKNKTFSGQIKQGQTGDCWLLAGLNSLIAKPQLLKALEKQITIDSQKGRAGALLHCGGQLLRPAQEHHRHCQ